MVPSSTDSYDNIDTTLEWDCATLEGGDNTHFLLQMERFCLVWCDR